MVNIVRAVLFPCILIWNFLLFPPLLLQPLLQSGSLSSSVFLVYRPRIRSALNEVGIGSERKKKIKFFFIPLFSESLNIKMFPVSPSVSIPTFYLVLDYGKRFLPGLSDSALYSSSLFSTWQPQ